MDFLDLVLRQLPKVQQHLALDLTARGIYGGGDRKTDSLGRGGHGGRMVETDLAEMDPVLYG